MEENKKLKICYIKKIPPKFYLLDDETKEIRFYNTFIEALNIAIKDNYDKLGNISEYMSIIEKLIEDNKSKIEQLKEDKKLIETKIDNFKMGIEKLKYLGNIIDNEN